MTQVLRWQKGFNGEVTRPHPHQTQLVVRRHDGRAVEVNRSHGDLLSPKVGSEKWSTKDHILIGQTRVQVHRRDRWLKEIPRSPWTKRGRLGRGQSLQDEDYESTRDPQREIWSMEPETVNSHFRSYLKPMTLMVIYKSRNSHPWNEVIYLPRTKVIRWLFCDLLIYFATCGSESRGESILFPCYLTFVGKLCQNLKYRQRE